VPKKHFSSPECKINISSYQKGLIGINKGQPEVLLGDVDLRLNDLIYSSERVEWYPLQGEGQNGRIQIGLKAMNFGSKKKIARFKISLMNRNLIIEISPVIVSLHS
jgi:hypothetical protein